MVKVLQEYLVSDMQHQRLNQRKLTWHMAKHVKNQFWMRIITILVAVPQSKTICRF
jgi:hypothetical protein